MAEGTASDPASDRGQDPAVAVERVRRRRELAESLDRTEFGDVYVLSQESADRALTPARRSVIQALHRHDVGSQRELADRLDRDPGNVKRDIAVLIDEGIVGREQTGRAYRPYLKYDTVLVEPIPAPE